MIVVCNTCGKQFERKKSRIKTHNYCSRKCLGAANGLRSKKDHRRLCEYCGKEFIRRNHHGLRDSHFYCSRECAWANKVKKLPVNCAWCGRVYEKKRSDVARNKHNLCSRDCYLDFVNFAKAGARNQRIGDKIIYRTLAEMNIGRDLTSSDHVHHIDGNHCNNSKDNLAVMSNSEHMVIHAAQKRRSANGRFTKKE